MKTINGKIVSPCDFIPVWYSGGKKRRLPEFHYGFGRDKISVSYFEPFIR